MDEATDSLNLAIRSTMASPTWGKSSPPKGGWGCLLRNKVWS